MMAGFTWKAAAQSSRESLTPLAQSPSWALNVTGSYLMPSSRTGVPPLWAPPRPQFSRTSDLKRFAAASLHTPASFGREM